MRKLLVTLVASAVLCTVASKTVNSEDPSAPAPMKYVAQQPQHLRVRAEHRVIARFDGITAVTAADAEFFPPPVEGKYATFTVTNYLHFEIKDSDPTPQKNTEVSIRLTDADGRPIFGSRNRGGYHGSKDLNATILGLKSDDLVQLEWKELYGKTGQGVFGPSYPILLLKKITATEAARAIEEKDIPQP